MSLLHSFRRAIEEQKVISILFGAALVVLISILLSNRTPSGSSPASPQVEVTEEQDTFSSVRSKAQKQPKVMPPEIQALLADKTRDNPFALPRLSNSAPPKVRYGTFVLEGIIWDEARPLAIVNNTIVAEGEELNGRKIVEIGKDRIVVERGEQRDIFTLDEESEK